MPLTTEELEILHALSKQTAQTKEHMKKHGISSLSELVRRSPSPTETFSEEEREAYRAKRAEEGLAHCRAQAAKAPMIGPVPVPAHVPAHHLPIPPFSSDCPLPGPPLPLCRDVNSLRWGGAVAHLEREGLDELQVFSSSNDWTYFVRRTPQGIKEEIYHNGTLVNSRPHRH